MLDYKISVIVPIYKVEAYMEKCVDSILNQSYKNLEIILVNDGSPDNCPKMCDEYAAKDGRIKVVHKKNGGLASARNAGLKVCTGEYISFIDSDDWIEPTMYSDCLEVCLSHDCDFVGYSATTHVVCSDKLNLGYTAKIRGGTSGDFKFFTLDEYFTDYLNGNIFVTAWSRFCKRDVCVNVEFPENRIVCEDAFVVLPTLENAKKIAYLEKSLYNYVLRENSLSTSKITIAKLKCFLDVYYSWFVYSEKCGKIYHKLIRKKYQGLFERAAKLLSFPIPHKLFSLIPINLFRFTVSIFAAIAK